MNIEKILAEYDSMFGKYRLEEIEAFLVKHVEEAKTGKELKTLVTLLNELIGFYRDTTQKEKALHRCNDLILALNELKLEGSIPYATSLLNIANAYRAFDHGKEAIALFRTVYEIYEKQIDKKDFLFASLYNNWALAYQELGEFDHAVEMLRKSLEVVDAYAEAVIPQATTRTNLAISLLGVKTEAAYQEAMVHLQEALRVFQADGGKDFHYGAALVAMGDAYSYKKEYEKAARYYQLGLDEIEKHTGKNENYKRVLEKYDHAAGQMKKEGSWISNMEKSRAFYENYGKPMIDFHFSRYADRIAVGLVGEGSDCFGFDDEISTDHDYEVGFCMWLTEADYKEIGKDLQNEYEKLVKASDRLSSRRGVFSINQFYGGLLEAPADYENAGEISLGKLNEFQLATVTNGQVFKDTLGVFSKVRAKLSAYYPEDVWRKKLAQSVHEFSQYGQSNYARMMARKDAVTAMMCVGKAVESALDIAYLLERRYAPYYKWKKKGLEGTSLGDKLFPILEKIAKQPNQAGVWEGYRYSAASVHTEDANISLFEQVAEVLLAEMKAQKLVSGTELFLEYYIPQILKGNNMEILEKVIEEEWLQFDKVENEGGRASCQNNYKEFYVMRKSQYLAWTKEMLESFYQDLLAAKEKGWNLIMEKYARMMLSTTPDKYRALEKELPKLSEERLKIQEELVKIQVSWMEDFARKYPRLARNARSIRTIEDHAFNTSYETYLRGELGTYSEKTFLLYANFIVEKLKQGENLAEEIMGNTTRMYGYKSLKDAERDAE